MQTIKVTKLGQFIGHSGSIYALSRGFKGGTIMSGGTDKVVASWNTQTFQAENFSIQLDAAVYALDLFPSQNLIAIGNSNGGVHIIDWLAKKEIKLLKAHTKAIFDIKYSQVNNAFYLASGDGSISMYRMSTLEHLITKKICPQKIRNIALSPDHSNMAVACGDGSIRIFDAQKFTEKNSFFAHSFSVNSVKYHPTKELLLSGGKDAILNIWDSNTYALITSTPAHNYSIYSIAFNKTGSLFATASRDKTIKIWDATAFEFLIRIERKNFDGHRNSVNKLIWDKETDYLYSASDDKLIMCWNIQSHF